MMGARPGEDLDSTAFTLLEFQGKEDGAIAEEIGSFFAKISQEFNPVNIGRLPEEVRLAIEQSTEDEVLEILPEEVGDIISKVKINRGNTPGDIPPALYRAAAGSLKA